MDVCTYMYMCIHMHLPKCACAGEEIEIGRGKERGRERAYIYESTTFQILRQAEQHLEEVTKERSLYKSAIDTSKDSFRQFFTSDGLSVVNAWVTHYSG